MIRTTFAVILTALVLSGCDANDAQVDFRIAASAIPSGIFRTDDGSTALNGENDPDDWRTSPLYATSGFFVSNRAYPNPASLIGSESVTIVISTIDGIPGGLQLVARDGLDRRTVLTPFVEIQSGFTAFTFFAAEIQSAQAGELWRLVFFDNRGEPVTYGDIMIDQ